MFINRGLLIYPEDFNETWLDECREAGLNVLGLHPAGGVNAHESLASAMLLNATPAFQTRIARAVSMGISIEYEAHTLSWLLPRTLFRDSPQWFRMNEQGSRVPDFHMCVSNRDALDYVASRAELLSRQLCTGSHRWFFWPDDVHGTYCHCPDCQKLTPSDQVLLITNAIASGIRRFDPAGRAAFLAYQDTLETPGTVTPEDGVFLEFAPIWRDHHRSLDDASCEKNVKETRHLCQLLSFFGKDNAQALDYWMDNSLFSQWQKPPQPFTLDTAVLERDAAFYDHLGFTSVTSFGCYLGEDYRLLYGRPDIAAYGRRLFI